jgi:hypothetical protein
MGGTHKLKGAEEGTSQKSERKQATQSKSNTHPLESTEARTSQDSKREQVRGTHPLERAGGQGGKSRH